MSDGWSVRAASHPDFPSTCVRWTPPKWSLSRPLSRSVEVNNLNDSAKKRLQEAAGDRVKLLEL